jgi:hypothetical protein
MLIQDCTGSNGFVRLDLVHSSTSYKSCNLVIYLFGLFVSEYGVIVPIDEVRVLFSSSKIYYLQDVLCQLYE